MWAGIGLHNCNFTKTYYEVKCSKNPRWDCNSKAVLFVALLAKLNALKYINVNSTGGCGYLTINAGVCNPEKLGMVTALHAKLWTTQMATTKTTHSALLKLIKFKYKEGYTKVKRN